MAFFEINCLNGQFEYAIQAGEPAVKLPIQAFAEIFDEFECLVKMPAKSDTWRRK